VTLADGRTVSTWQYGRDGEPHTAGSLDFAALRWSVDRGAIAADGRLVPPDALANLGRPIVVTASLIGQDHVRASLVLRPDYACPVESIASGDPGEPGAPARLVDGERRHGPYHWTPGEPGGPGDSAPAVDVTLGLVASPSGPLAIARIDRSDGGDARYIVRDPRAPAIAVFARGGSGGAPGAGAKRDAADGGDGGVVTIRYDALHPELRALARAYVDGGGAHGDGHDGTDGEVHVVAGDPRALFAAEIAAGVPIVTAE
jgi:hypothetical protein